MPSISAFVMGVSSAQGLVSDGSSEIGYETLSIHILKAVRTIYNKILLTLQQDYNKAI